MNIIITMNISYYFALYVALTEMFVSIFILFLGVNQS